MKPEIFHFQLLKLRILHSQFILKKRSFYLFIGNDCILLLSNDLYLVLNNFLFGILILRFPIGPWYWYSMVV